ncbi:MarR family transcriptional regulator [Sphingomonas sp. PP-CE-1G-424]|uniref:MarR family winged helix-turn-helix transcriptional regulator n=1 Tax=Sphingomonas sp. PP-CE-1G-424 TaxID=2135658 RepID=UPI0010F2B8A8|nr:MarR family transcriptional regulator [Sphingomonas sp. PP-CE-1G-424]TCP65583.1 DNA-binding MarR family transcriptional regulator [Sphingomonas sp. PP-CE-1G-424]
MHNTLNSALLRELHRALIDIVSVMNQPQRDEAMVREAGIALDRALFPLLVMVERLEPIGIVDLADRVGRDYTTVSRQVTKLEGLGFVERRSSATDGRVRAAVITASGKALTDKIDMTRETMARRIFADWKKQDVSDLTRLMRRFADAVQNDPAEQG